MSAGQSSSAAFRIGPEHAVLMASHEALPFAVCEWLKLRALMALTNGALPPLIALIRAEAAQGNAYAINALAWHVLYGIGDAYGDVDAAVDARHQREREALALPDADSQQSALFDIAMDFDDDVFPHNPYRNAYVAVPLWELSAALGCVAARANLLCLQLRRVPAAIGLRDGDSCDPGTIGFRLAAVALSARRALFALADEHAADVDLALCRVYACSPFGQQYPEPVREQETLKWLRAPPLCVDAVNQKRVPTRALLLYGYIHGNGCGVKVDPARCLALYKAAAARNDTTAALQDLSIAVGPFWMHRKPDEVHGDANGNGGDPVQWMALLSKAAAQPDGVDARVLLASMHLRGVGHPHSQAARVCPRDTRKAEHWSRRALELGHPSALLSLGLCESRYSVGDTGADPDTPEAVSEADVYRHWKRSIVWHRRNAAAHPARSSTSGWHYAPGDIRAAPLTEQPPRVLVRGFAPHCARASAALFLRSVARPLPGTVDACDWGDEGEVEPHQRRDDYPAAGLCCLYRYGGTARHVLRGVEYLRFALADDDETDKQSDADATASAGADRGEGDSGDTGDDARIASDGDVEDEHAPDEAGARDGGTAVPVAERGGAVEDRTGGQTGAGAGAAAAGTGGAVDPTVGGLISAADLAAIAAAQADVNGSDDDHDGDGGGVAARVADDGLGSDSDPDDDDELTQARRELRRLAASEPAIAAAAEARQALAYAAASS
uniref:Predicted protein n=1 Tax=Hordeum vulgare subsp. vulgare TaxID=112509 RepID=F2E0Q0_HORVV|nr:predicted protein [Hordeum vulgare subsp. vulgare]